MTATLIGSEQHTDEPQEIKLRKVTTRDLFTVVKVVIPRLDMPRIRKIFTDAPKDSNEKEAYFTTAGLELLMMVLEVSAEADIQRWLADLAGLTLEQFLDSDVETAFRIVQAMWQDEDINKLFRTLIQ
jgi:hypothetical protein